MLVFLYSAQQLAMEVAGICLAQAELALVEALVLEQNLHWGRQHSAG